MNANWCKKTFEILLNQDNIQKRRYFDLCILLKENRSPFPGIYNLEIKHGWILDPEEQITGKVMF